MDHCMRYVKGYMKFSIEELRKEHESGQYAKLTNCPSYKEVKVYCNSYNALADYYFDGDKSYRLTPSKLMKG